MAEVVWNDIVKCAALALVGGVITPEDEDGFSQVRENSMRLRTYLGAYSEFTAQPNESAKARVERDKELLQRALTEAIPKFMEVTELVLSEGEMDGHSRTSYL